MKEIIAPFIYAAIQFCQIGIVALLIGLPVTTWTCPFIWEYNVFYQGAVPAVCIDPESCINACDASDGPACAHLGKFFLGSKLGTDFRRAAGCFNRACGLGQDSSCRMAGLISENVGSFNVLPDAGELWLAGCRRGGPESCGAWLHRFTNPELASEELMADAVEAQHHVRQACKAGEIESCRTQALLELATKPGDDAPETRALRLARAGCRLNDPMACISLWALLKNDKSEAALAELYSARQSAQAISIQRCLASSDYYACYNADALYPYDESPAALAARERRQSIESEWLYGFQMQLCTAGDDAACMDFVYAISGPAADPTHLNPNAQESARVYELLEMSCARGSAAACNFLAYRIQTGWGVSPDMARALQLYEKSCGHGGCAELAYLTGSGQLGTVNNSAKALEYAHRACLAGDTCVCDQFEQAASENDVPVDWTVANSCTNNFWVEKTGATADLD